MRKIILSVALMVLAGGPDAFAQRLDGAEKFDAADSSGAGRASPAARRATFRTRRISTIRTIVLSRENAILDKKIKSICRGC